MGRLAAHEIKGVWAGMTMSWDDKDRFDEAAYRANTERMCASGVHGLYTTGSTGEFYAIEYEEFCQMVDIQAEICGRYKTALQIGCCADSTRKIIKLMQYAAGKPEVGAVQVVLPYWMELTDREVLQYFKDLYTAFPDLPLVHYNIPRAKRFLAGTDYVRILEAAPSLVGVKFTFAGSHFAELQQALLLTPQLSYFVAEDLLVSAMMLGARGSYSSLVATNPRFMLTLYEHAAHCRWPEALEMQKLATKFFDDSAAFIEQQGEGAIDPVFDKGLAVAAGCITGSARIRAPYIGWSGETIAAMRTWLKEKYPQFVFPEGERAAGPSRG